MARSRVRVLDTFGVLRRNPGFARAYAAQLVSFGGDWFALVALQALILETTGRADLAGLMLVVHMIPFALVSPFAGVLVDRVDRKAVMVFADVVRALIALGYLLADDRDTLWIAFVCTGAMSLLHALFEPASTAALPNLVRREDLPGANVLLGSAWGTMLAVGAAAGGIVAATLGKDAAFIGDALSFLVSAGLLLSVRERFQEREPGRAHEVSIMGDILETGRFARDEPKVLSLLLVKGGFGIAGGLIAMISVMAVDEFGSDETGIGIMMGTRGLGALVGPFIFRALFDLEGRGLFQGIAVAFAVFACGYALFGVAPVFWLATLGPLVAHLGGGAQWTMSTFGLQRYAPDRIRGRIFAADYMLITLSMGVSMGIAGVLAEQVGPRPVTLGLAALAFGWSVAWTALTRRHWPPHEDVEPAGARVGHRA